MQRLHLVQLLREPPRDVHQRQLRRALQSPKRWFPSRPLNGEQDPTAALQLQNKKSESIQTNIKAKKYLPLSVRQERPKAIAWLIREHGKVLTDTQIAKLTSSTKPTVANIRAGNQSQPITEFRNPMDLGLCSYEDLELLVEKGQRKAEKEKKPHVQVTQQMKLDANDPSKPKMVTKDLAKQIIQARTSKKMTQKQLALAINEEVSVINKYEK